MASSDAQNAWVDRVLGVRIGDAAAPEDMDLSGRLRSAGGALRGLRDASAPEAAGLVARYAQVMATAKTDPVAASVALDGLEADIARATAAARAREGGPQAGRGVAYRKLLLRWREAQGTLDASLKTFGSILLSQPDVQSDPRLEQVKRGVEALPKLVPQFGGRLEDVLDAAMNATDPAELARLTAEGIAAIDTYRQQLAAAKPLLDLEEFAEQDLGAALPLHGALDQALVELKQQLAA